MEQSTTHWDDISRILFGEVPFSFFIELLLRALVIYLVLVFALRLMGKRMARGMSRNELAAIATLAAAMGMPLQAPDRGLLPGIIIAMLVVLIQRGVAALSAHKSSIERITQGKISILIEDHQLKFKAMEQTRISRERVFSQLRSQGIRHLGEVKRFYLEASGSFTLIREKEPQPGMSVLPIWDTDFTNEQQQEDTIVCSNCGSKKETLQAMICNNCHQQHWIKAVC